MVTRLRPVIDPRLRVFFLLFTYNHIRIYRLVIDHSTVFLPWTIDVKTFFYILVTFLRFLKLFLFSKRFFILKNVGKVQSGKQINKKHFQNYSNETDL